MEHFPVLSFILSRERNLFEDNCHDLELKRGLHSSIFNQISNVMDAASRKITPRSKILAYSLPLLLIQDRLHKVKFSSPAKMSCIREAKNTNMSARHSSKASNTAYEDTMEPRSVRSSVVPCNNGKRNRRSAAKTKENTYRRRQVLRNQICLYKLQTFFFPGSQSCEASFTEQSIWSGSTAGDR